VAVISPAIWLNYDQAKTANSTAFASLKDFNEDNVVVHKAALKSIPIRIACSDNDPFYPDILLFVNALPSSSNVYFGNGCHTDEFFALQEPLSLKFLSDRLH
jgi:hypothetical protein